MPIHYVLFFWVTTHFHMMELMDQNQRRTRMFHQVHQVAAPGKKLPSTNADLFSIYSNNMKYERKNYIKEAKQAPILKNLIDNSEINKRPGGRITCEQCHAGQQGWLGLPAAAVPSWDHASAAEDTAPVCCEPRPTEMETGHQHPQSSCPVSHSITTVDCILTGVSW